MNEFRLLMDMLETQSQMLAQQIDDPELTLEQRAFIVGKMSGIQETRERLRETIHRRQRNALRTASPPSPSKT